MIAVITAGITFLAQKYVLADLEDFASTASLGPAATEASCNALSARSASSSSC